MITIHSNTNFYANLWANTAKGSTKTLSDAEALSNIEAYYKKE